MRDLTGISLPAYDLSLRAYDLNGDELGEIQALLPLLDELLGLEVDLRTE
jgi:hypothetical protein